MDSSGAVSRRTRSRRSMTQSPSPNVPSGSARSPTQKSRDKSMCSFSTDEEGAGGDVAWKAGMKENALCFSTPKTPNVLPLPRREARSPLTPMHNLVVNMRQRLEQQMGGSMSDSLIQNQSDTSPVLAKLRNTPVKAVKQRQRVLQRKHHEAKSRSDSLSVGGGVTMWPEMASMRLTLEETWTLVAISTVLAVTTCALFYWMHGTLWSNLQLYAQKVMTFYHTTSISGTDQAMLDSSVLHWHGTFSTLMHEVEDTFSISLGSSPVSYQISVLVYCLGITVLLYYLADSVVSKSKLTPGRIKVWVSLLVVCGLWTVLALVLLLYAQRLERSLERAVHLYSEQLAELVYTNHDLTTFHNVLTIWRTRCLPPTAPGTLSILGLVPVRDVAYYLQYYSLPVLTALVTPILKLIMSLKDIYSVELHPS